jgi:alpha-N-acetylglucosaminidase
MFFRGLFLLAIIACSSGTSAAVPSTQGILDLVKRRLPNHVENFEFAVVENTNSTSSAIAQLQNDIYTVSTPADGKVRVEGSSLSALAMGCVITCPML